MTVLQGAHLGEHVVLIIGAGAPKSIGFATAEAMAVAGATVALADLPNSSVRDSLRWLAPGVGHSAHHVDVSQPESVDSLVAEVVAQQGRIDVLVNAAAILEVQSFLDLEAASWTRTFAVNAMGQFLAGQAVARQMVKQGHGGRIIAVASNVGRIPRINNAAYAASKAAVIHLVRAMALELARFNITVNALCPGSTATSMLIDNQAAGDPSRLDGIIHGSIEQWRTGIPLGRLAEPEDQAATCVFLASQAARHITGQAVCVDGGQTLF